MKDVVITSRRVKIELWSLLVCFVLANVVNIYSIFAYKSDWNELLSMWYIVLPLSVAFYVAFSILRIVIAVATKLFAKK